METEFRIFPVGTVHKTSDRTTIDIKPEFLEALEGLDQFSHIVVLYWFHQNDAPEKRQTLQVRPKKDPRNPLTGVFATHSPMRPNLIALTYCKLLGVDGNVITIDDIDAFDGTPVIDIKSYFPVDKLASEDIKTPNWHL